MMLKLLLEACTSLMLGQGPMRSQLGLQLEESWVYTPGSWDLQDAGFPPSLKRKYSRWGVRDMAKLIWAPLPCQSAW